MQSQKAVVLITRLSYFFFVLQKATGNDASEDAAGFSNLLLLALATFSTAYNVFLYIIFNPSFRNAILGVLRCTKTSEVNKIVTLERSNSPESPQDVTRVDNQDVNDVNSYNIEVITTSSEFRNG